MKKDEMTSRERVLCALRREVPDKVPWVEDEIAPLAVYPLMGRPQAQAVADSLHGNIKVEKAISRFTGRDNITFYAVAPEFCDKTIGGDGICYYGDGHIRTESDLDKIDLPDPTRDAFYEDAETFVSQKENFATCAVSRLGFASTYLSMGMENFFLQTLENPRLVLQVLERYTEWEKVVLKRLGEIGFDYLLLCDDLGYKEGPMISPDMYRSMFLPHLKAVADVIEIPWICHSDGNLMSIMEDWLSMGQDGINPIEPQAMDINAIKSRYGSRVCISGNLDVDLLAQGTPQGVELQVKMLIRELAPGGGYIFASGNSIPSYTKPENLKTMVDTFTKYRNYPIRVDS